MSRIGRRKINIPKGIDISINNKEILVKGPLGELRERLHSKIEIEIKDKEITLSPKNPEDRDQRAIWGLYNALINNMVIGVSSGFSKELEINGVGYKAVVEEQKIILHVGFSRPIEIELPKGIECKVNKNIIIVSGIDKQLVGEIAARIRQVRKPEPYKGKGIKYVNEHIIRKAGKQVKSAEEGGGGS